MKKILSFAACFFAACTLSSQANAQVITTIAGTGVAGYNGDGILATAAQVNYPFGVTVDQTSGDIYIADAVNDCIRMIDPATGIITTVAGTPGTPGATGNGGAATAATLNNPTSVAIDASGNMYIADKGNNMIRMVSGGIITTVVNTAGTAGYSGDGAAATAARINSPYGVAVDAAGDLFIADAGNNRVREVTAPVATGNIRTVAGTRAGAGFSGDGGVAGRAQVNHPEGVAVDAAGNLYIADTYNDRIRKVAAPIATGNISTVAGNGSTVFVGGGLATASGLNMPSDIAFDATGNFYIADANNNQVEMVTIATGDISLYAGTGTQGYNGDCQSPTTAQLYYPSGISFDAAGDLYIADSGNSRIREITQPCSGTPAVASVTANSVTGCTAFTSTLTATGLTTGCGISYQWDSSTDGVTFTAISGATSSTYTAVVTGASQYYNFVVTCSYSGDISTSNTYTLSVAAPPAIDPITGGFTPMCSGMTMSLADGTSGGTWSVTNASGTILSFGFFTANTAGTDTILYGVPEGCGTVYDTFIVTIDPMLAPGASINAFPGAIVCPGDSVRLNAIPINGGTAPTYVWHINGFFFSTADTISYFPANGDIVTCTITSNAFCASPDTGVGTVTMVIDSFIKPGISINDGLFGDSVCEGVATSFYAVDTNGGAVPVNTWYVNGTPAGTGTILTYAPSNGDVVECRLISSFVCAVPDTVFSNIKDMSVYTTELPAITIFEDGGNPSCTGINMTFTAHGIFGGTTPFYRWSVNDVNVGTGPTYTFLPATGDSIYCMMASSSTCRSTDTVFSNALITTVEPYVAPSVVINASAIMYATGEYDTITATPTNGGTTPTYQWYVNGVLVPGVTGATYITDSLNNNDVVSCIVTSSNACATPSTSTSNSITFINVGVKEITANSINATIFPNPNKGSFMLQGSIGNNSSASIEITDVLGQVVYKQNVTAQNGSIKKEIRFNGDVSDGIYLLHLTTGDETAVIRFTVTK